MSEQKHHWIALATRLAVVALLLAVGVGVSALFLINPPTPAERGPQAGRVEVPVFRTHQAMVARQWRGYGTANAMDAADVPARLTATVENVPPQIEAGRPVEKGDLLVQLDATDFQHDAQMAQQRLVELRPQLDQLKVQQTRLAERMKLEKEDTEVAQREFDRVQRLMKRNAGTQQEVDRAQREVIVAQRARVNTAEALEQIPAQREQLNAQIEAQNAAIEQAKLNIKRTHITSPMAGILDAVDVEEGESIASGQRVARVVSLARIEVPLRLPASARGDLVVGDEAVLYATDDSAPELVGPGAGAFLQRMILPRGR